MHRILYIDDEPGLLEIAKRFLEKTGDFSVDINTSPVDAIRSLDTQVYNAIVSDYLMPDMDGIELLKAVRKSRGNIPFILFTGRGREEVVIEAINNGVDFYLQKGGDPKVQFAELAHKIRQAIARWHAEQSLIESEKRLTDLINFLPDATFAINQSGQVIAWNRAIEEMTGVPASDMIGKGDHEYSIPFYGDRRRILIDLVFEPDDVIAKSYADIVHEKDLLIAVTSLPRPKGRVVTLMGKASPLYNQQGEIVGAIEAIRDITALKKAEEGLFHAKKDWESIFRAIGHPVIVLNNKNQIIDANDATLRLTGRSLEELKSKRCYQVFHAPDSDEPYDGCPFEQVRKTGKIGTNEIEIKAFNGYYTVTCTPVFDQDGNLEKVIHIAMDITEKRRTKDELLAAYEQLTSSEQELRDQFDKLVQNEQKIRESELRLKYLLGFYEMTGRPERELLSYAVEVAGSVTGSPLAYLAFLNDKEDELAMYAWSRTAMEECSIQDKPLIYPVESTGLWGDAVRQRKPVITNDYQATDTRKKGYPQGHPHIIRHMNIPVLDGDHIVIVAGVANKPSGYTDNDVRDLNLLMQGLWQVLKRQRAEEGLMAAYQQLEASDRELRKNYKELERSEQLVRESENRFRELAELLPQMVFETDPRFQITYANRYALSAIGLTDEDIERGITTLSYIDPSQHDRVRLNTEKMIRGEQVDDHEYTAVRKDGTRFPILIYSSPVYRDGKHEGFRGVIIDITDRKRNEDLLKEREATLESIFRAAPVGIGLVSNRVLFSVNDRICEMTRYSAGELVGNNTRLLYPTVEEYEWVGREKDEQIRDYGIGTLVSRWKRKDGVIRDIQLSITPLDPKNPSSGETFTVQDITDRKRADEELRAAYEQLAVAEKEVRGQFDELVATQGVLREQQQQMEEITEMVPGVVYQFYARPDGNMGVYFVSNRALELFGISNKAGDFFEWFTRQVDPRDRESFLNSINEAARSESSWNYEGRFIKPSGELIWFQGISRPSSRESEIVYNGILLDITARKLAERALLESEEKYRLLVEHSNDGIFIVQDDCLVFYNRAFSEMTGYNEMELIGHAIPDLIAPEDRDVVFARYRERVAGKTVPEAYEFSVLHKDNLKRIRVRMHAGTGMYRGRVATFGTFQNITEDRKREESLQESENRLRLITENMVDLITQMDKDKKIIFTSPSVERLTGYSYPELAGRTATDKIHPGDIERVIREMQSAIAQHRQSVRLDYRYLLKSGEYRWFESETRILYDQNGEFNGSIFTSRDITERKNIEEGLREKTEEINLYFSTSLDLFCIADTTGYFRRLNAEWEKTLGYRISEMEGQKFLDFVHPDDLQSTLAAVADLDNQKEVLNFTNRYRHKDGSYRWIEWRAVPRANMIFAAARDITERMNMENAIREANRKLNLLNSVTRHDVANQLTILQGYIQIAEIKNPDPVISDLLIQIDAATQAIARLTDFTRTYQEMGIHTPGWYRLWDAIKRAADYEVRLSESCRKTEVFADPMLERVFFNIFDNAARHGERVTEVAVSCDERPEGLVITIKDNGIGIQNSEKEKIFERGYGKNTGFGLFLAREILSITGIKIREDGVAGEGARFEISVPKGMYRFRGKE